MEKLRQSKQTKFGDRLLDRLLNRILNRVLKIENCESTGDGKFLKFRNRFTNQKSMRFTRRMLNLFICFILLSLNCFAITPNEIREIEIIPTESVLFTNQEVKYVLEIPEVAPSYVSTELATMPEGVTFVSSRRMEYFTNDNVTGTRIEFWFSFKKTGTVELPQLRAYINGRSYRLNFRKVNVYENPKTIAPVVVIELNKQKQIYSNLDYSKNDSIVYEAQVGEQIEFDIYIQYAVLIKQFGYQIPKDSLFEEIKRFDIVKSRLKSNDFSREKIPVAKFVWTPLKEGVVSFPVVGLVAVAYSGRSLELVMPEVKINVKKSTKSVASNSNKSQLFSYALTSPIEENIVSNEVNFSKEDFIDLGKLREKERNTFLPFSIKKQRKQVEEKIGITNSKDEANVLLWYVFLIILFIDICVCVILFVCKKNTMAILFMCLAICFASITIYSGICVSIKHGVVTGGVISPVPEDSSISTTKVTTGACVTIKQETKHWYNI